MPADKRQGAPDIGASTKRTKTERVEKNGYVFLCDQELGRGGFGRVIRGHKVGETRVVAIKFLPLSKVKNEVAPCPTSGPKST